MIEAHSHWIGFSYRHPIAYILFLRNYFLMENVLETIVILCGVRMFFFWKCTTLNSSCNIIWIPVGLRTRHHGLSKRVIKQHSCSGNLYIQNKLNIIIIDTFVVNQYIYFDMPPEITPSPCAKCVCGSRLPMSNKSTLAHRRLLREDQDSVYKCPAFAGRDSLDTKPVTGSLHFAASGCRLADFIAEGLVLCASRDSAEFLLAVVWQALRILLWHYSDTEMATGGDR